MFKEPEDEAELLLQLRWLLDLLTRLGHLTYFRIHVMPIIRGQEKCDCGRDHPLFSKNDDMRGFADILVLSRGRTGFLETKSRRGILSTAQRLFSERVSRSGHPYLSIKRLEEAVAFLEERMEVPVYGVLKGLAPASNPHRGGVLGPTRAPGVPREDSPGPVRSGQQGELDF